MGSSQWTGQALILAAHCDPSLCMGALVYPVISFYSAWLAMCRWTPVRPVAQVLLTWAGGASLDLGGVGVSLT